MSSGPTLAGAEPPRRLASRHPATCRRVELARRRRPARRARRSGATSTLAVRAGRVRRGARPERRRQVDAAARSSSACSRCAPGTRHGARRARRARRTPRSATCRSGAASTPSTRIRGRRPRPARARRRPVGRCRCPGAGRARGERGRGGHRARRRGRLRAPADRRALRRRAAAAADRPGARRAGRSCCCSTSRSTASTCRTRPPSPALLAPHLPRRGRRRAARRARRQPDPRATSTASSTSPAGGAVSGTPEEVITSDTLSALYGVADRGAAHLRRAARRRRPAGGARAPLRPARSPQREPGDRALLEPVVGLPRSCGRYPFMVNALEAGTIVAVLAAVVGWFMVLRRQSFAGHTLAVDRRSPARPAPRWLGIPLAAGYFTFCAGRRAGHRRAPAGGAARPLARSPRSSAPCRRSALALGFLFLSLYDGFLESLRRAALRLVPRHHARPGPDAARASRPPSLLFFAVVGRPLLFASVDPTSPRARGVPVRALELGFLLVLGARGRRDGADHRCAARLRAARRCPPRPPSSSPPRPALGLVLSVRARAGGHLARRWLAYSRRTRSGSG